MVTTDAETMHIDVGRGYKGATLHMNDIQKDAEYASWSTDVENEMMMQLCRLPSWILLANEEDLKHCRPSISTSAEDHYYYLKKYQDVNFFADCLNYYRLIP